MKTLYLCGPIGDCSDAECKDWRAHATRMLKHKFRILDPMRRDHRGRESASVAEIVNGDYFDVRSADMLLVNGDPSPDSWGTPMEVKEAFDARTKLVVAFRDPAHRCSPWLVMHSHFVAKSVEDAVAFFLLP